jgi:hypothetical protein
MSDVESPNTKIDKAIEGLLKKIDKKDEDGNQLVPDDTTIKIIAQAIAWEKVKHHIADKKDGFDPDDI